MTALKMSLVLLLLGLMQTAGNMLASELELGAGTPVLHAMQSSDSLIAPAAGSALELQNRLQTLKLTSADAWKEAKKLAAAGKMWQAATYFAHCASQRPRSTEGLIREYHEVLSSYEEKLNRDATAVRYRSGEKILPEVAAGLRQLARLGSKMLPDREVNVTQPESRARIYVVDGLLLPMEISLLSQLHNMTVEAQAGKATHVCFPEGYKDIPELSQQHMLSDLDCLAAGDAMDQFLHRVDPGNTTTHYTGDIELLTSLDAIIQHLSGLHPAWGWAYTIASYKSGQGRLLAPDCVDGFEYNPKKEKAASLFAFLSPEGGLVFPEWDLLIAAQPGRAVIVLNFNDETGDCDPAYRYKVQPPAAGNLRFVHRWYNNIIDRTHQTRLLHLQPPSLTTSAEHDSHNVISCMPGFLCQRDIDNLDALLLSLRSEMNF